MNQKDIKFIGLTGGSGSGKTSFIRDLKSKFSSEQLCIISQDDYYRPRDQQKTDDKGVHNFDIPYSIDHEAFFQDLFLQINEVMVKLDQY